MGEKKERGKGEGENGKEKEKDHFLEGSNYTSSFDNGTLVIKPEESAQATGMQ